MVNPDTSLANAQKVAAEAVVAVVTVNATLAEVLVTFLETARILRPTTDSQHCRFFLDLSSMLESHVFFFSLIDVALFFLYIFV